MKVPSTIEVVRRALPKEEAEPEIREMERQRSTLLHALEVVTCDEEPEPLAAPERAPAMR